MFGICRRTVYCIRSDYGLVDSYNVTRISDFDLEYQVGLTRNLMPEYGQSFVKDTLQARAMYVPLP